MTGRSEEAETSATVVTIVTATHNAVRGLARTAASIRRQAHAPIQWIVVDGASTDGTVDEIARNADIIDFWISEPDTGIYNAWNKACARIAGEWVLFIGAGDELADPNVLRELVPRLREAESSHEIVYGRIELVSEAGERIAEIGESWKELKGKWGGLLPLMPPHPSSFHHKALFRGAASFDESYRYAGDSAFVVRSVMRRDPLYVPLVVDRMLVGGVSARPDNLLRIARERRRIAESLPIKAPLRHRIAWYVTLALQLTVNRMVPTAVRRPLKRVVRSWRSR